MESAPAAGFDQPLDDFDTGHDMGVMGALHLTKIAYGCDSIDELASRIEARASKGAVAITTRYRPKRHEELVGGSLYWIVKRRLAVRQRILGFGEAEDGRWHILLDATLVPVRARPKRPHQGWRYLAAEDAPADVGGDESGISELPPGLLEELARLAIV